MPLKITFHAIDRAKERIGIPRSAAERLSERALADGLTFEETTGSLRNYLELKHAHTQIADHFRLYAGKCFCFRDGCLITVFPLPRELLRVFQKQMARKRERMGEIA